VTPKNVEGLAGRNSGRAGCVHETCGQESGRFRWVLFPNFILI
jgi:hypothetical protein